VLRTSVIRFCGLTAIVAGILRGITSFIPGTTPRIMLLYLVTDVFLFFGTIGLYLFQPKEIGLVGTSGFVLQILGTLTLIGRDLAIFGDSLYPVAALMFAAGLDLFAVGSWGSKKLPRWILSLWILSTIVGPIGYFARDLAILFVASGMLFGIGFAAAGTTIWFSSANPTRRSSARDLTSTGGERHG
jgi:hypothetical protein